MGLARLAHLNKPMRDYPICEDCILVSSAGRSGFLPFQHARLFVSQQITILFKCIYLKQMFE
ncbi:hypothetical protein AWB69_01185 [Caballeronia udeis]|uniref:Uncharacterized protein n=1 Tax=Caballeronia udeis TaxID=1232866 RepID=A0A158FJU2_9BURK|nr:hypothetical protein AWB69_01185 [Caballeronia udeis]